MPKITDEDLEAIQVRLFQSDLNYLRSLYKGSFGVNKAIRNIVRVFVNNTKASAAEYIDDGEAQARANTNDNATVDLL